MKCARISHIVSQGLIGLIKVYKWTLSPLIGSCCRFTPTCSVYTMQAIRKYGPIKGVLKGLARILRCNPFFPGGYDPLE